MGSQKREGSADVLTGSQKREIGMLYLDGLRLRGYGLVFPFRGKRFGVPKIPKLYHNTNHA